MPVIEKQCNRFAARAVQAIPYMNDAYKQKIEVLTETFEDPGLALYPGRE